MRAPRLALSALGLTWLVTAPACDPRGPTAPPSGGRPPAAADGAAPAAKPAMSSAAFSTAPPDVFAPPADAEREPSGVARKILTPGKGKVHPNLECYVDLRYAGWERNGRQFEGTLPSPDMRRFDMKELVTGLATELSSMVEGERRRLWVPAALAYGQRTNFVNAPKGDMTYEVELVRIIPLPPAPADVAAAPSKGVKTTKSGLTYLVLEKGKGKQHPTENTRAEVVYSAWTPDGKMFQTSLINGDALPVRVRLLPPGWREAMQLMVEGDRWRLWLPGKLAFGELHPGEELLPFGPPPGPVVFDVRLVRIIE